MGRPPTAAAAAAAAAAASAAASIASPSTAVFIPPDCIGLEKPLPYHLLDPATHLSCLKFNVDWVSSAATLSNSEVIRARDGDVLVWTDVRAQGVALYNEYRESDDIVHHTARGERERQHALRIYSPQEQHDMELAIKQIEEMEKREREQAAATAAAAAKASEAAAAAVATPVPSAPA
jgi:hypothetical protein